MGNYEHNNPRIAQQSVIKMYEKSHGKQGLMIKKALLNISTNVSIYLKSIAKLFQKAFSNHSQVIKVLNVGKYEQNVLLHNKLN